MRTILSINVVFALLAAVLYARAADESAPFTGKISIDRFDMIDPRVQRYGDIAILTFNIVDYGAQLSGGPKSTARWNTTEIYQRIDGQWKIVHSHWSYTKPESK